MAEHVDRDPLLIPSTGEEEEVDPALTRRFAEELMDLANEAVDEVRRSRTGQGTHASETNP